MNDESSTSSRDRRTAVRKPVDIWVEESTERELYFQRCGNLSAGGIFLERTVPHAKGTRTKLRFTLPGDLTPIEVKGEIVNIAEDEATLGMGLRFVDLADADRARIESFVAPLAARHGVKAE